MDTPERPMFEPIPGIKLDQHHAEAFRASLRGPTLAVVEAFLALHAMETQVVFEDSDSTLEQIRHAQGRRYVVASLQALVEKSLSEYDAWRTKLDAPTPDDSDDDSPSADTKADEEYLGGQQTT